MIRRRRWLGRWLTPARYRWLAVAWAVIVLALLAVPSQSIPDTTVIKFDKVIHAVLFGAGAGLALRGWPRLPWRVLFVLILFSPLTEVWQAVLPIGREPDLYDVVADWIGVFVVWLALRWPWRRLRPERFGIRDTAGESNSAGAGVS